MSNGRVPQTYATYLRGHGGATWSRIESGTGLSLLGLHCNRADLCWAVGSYGKILQIGNAGSQGILRRLTPPSMMKRNAPAPSPW